MAEVLVNLDQVEVNLGGRTIWRELSWEIQDGQRVGLVGPNGAGKTTLLRLIAGELTPDAGAIYRAPGLSWGRLPQEPQLDDRQTVWEAALAAVPAMTEAVATLRRLEARLAEPAVYDDPAVLDRVMVAFERALHQYERSGGDSYESRAREALQRLGLDPASWDTPTGRLSGGQKKLVLLAQLVMRQPRLLLLDEPDNHLDLPAKEQLEAFIKAYAGGVIIISHDRYLLDEIADHIAELETGKLTLYPGNYSAYTAERALRRLRQQQLYAAQQKEIARLEAAIARFEQWASIVVNERHIRQARSRRRMLDQMDRIDPVLENRRLRLSLDGWRGSQKVLSLEKASLQLPDGRSLWQDLSATVWHGQRVGLVGPNGAGKSMLLRHMRQPGEVGGGEVRLGPSIQVGYYAQEHETLPFDDSLLNFIRRAAPLREDEAVAFLHRFLFTYDQARGLIGDLSGGERSRLQLARLVLERPNLLLLDEPTNNLDIPSIEVLEETLDEFVGTIIVVSHDRFFLDRVVDEIWELRAGRLHRLEGGYTDYAAGRAG